MPNIDSLALTPDDLLGKRVTLSRVLLRLTRADYRPITRHSRFTITSYVPYDARTHERAHYCLTHYTSDQVLARRVVILLTPDQVISALGDGSLCEVTN